ncbi:1734_t:CDS:2, partial [Dentiscutata erythropus]
LYHTHSPYTLHDSELYFENVAQVKRLADTIKYTGSIIAMANNTKIKEKLKFSLLLGCIIGSTLSTELIRISISKFPPCVIVIIANKGKETATCIFKLYKKLLDIAANLQLKILGFATALVKDVFGMIINTQIYSFMTILEDEEKNPKVKNEIKQPSTLQSVNNLQETKSIFISIAITKVNTWNKLNTLTKGSLQLALILDSTQQSQNLNMEMNIDVNIGVVNRMFKISELVNQHRCYKVYTSQRMKRRVVRYSIFAPSNRYSSLVLYLSSNKSACSGIPCQNC